MQKRVLLLGFGQTAKAVLAALEQSSKVYATTRNPNRIFELQACNVEPVIMPLPSAEIIEPLANESYVLVSFPPDGTTDSILAAACIDAKAIVYISSTGVYGTYRGEVTDDTPVETTDSHALARLEAEKIWLSYGATVLRAPGIYGTKSGLHTRLLNKNYSIPGDGSGVISRIHVEDLAQLVLAAWSSGKGAETYVVGDLNPVTQLEVVTWLCSKLGIEMPGFAPLDKVSPTLRGNRLVRSHRALQELGVTLRYPTYKEGFEHCIKQSENI